MKKKGNKEILDIVEGHRLRIRKISRMLRAKDIKHLGILRQATSLTNDIEFIAVNFLPEDLGLEHNETHAIVLDLATDKIYRSEMIICRFEKRLKISNE